MPVKIDEEYRHIFPDLDGKFSELIPRRRRMVKVKIGKPIRFNENDDYNLATKKLEEAIRKL